MTAEAQVAAPAVTRSTVFDEAAFGELVRLHQKRVFRIALRMLGDVDDAATATQDCFLRAFRAISRCPNQPDHQRFWMTRLVTNVCFDRLRNRRWRWWRERLGITASERQAPVLRTPERELLARELADSLARALDRLSPKQRAVFVLRHYEGCPLDQIAAQLSMRVGTVKSHLGRALQTLRRELKDFYYGQPAPE